MAEEALPSLKRLQNVEKDYEDVEGQILAVRQILSDTKKTSSRAQWILRWMLKKLQNQDQIGKRARALPETWHLLQVLVNLLKSTSLAQSYQPLAKIVAQALHECADVFTDKLPTADESTGKKRKASEDHEHPPKRRKDIQGNSQPANGPPQCLRSIKSRLDVLIRVQNAYSFQPEMLASGSTPSSSRPVLRVDHDTARILLLAGARALAQSLLHDDLRRDAASSNLVECTSALFHAWENKRITSGTSMCLYKDDVARKAQSWLLMSVAASQHATGAETSRLKAIDGLARFMRDVEHFVAKYTIMPLKSAFQSLPPIQQMLLAQASDMDQESPLNAMSATANDIFTPDSSPGNTPLFLSEYLPLYNESVLVLLETVLKCSNVHSPKKRATDLTWIRAVFSRTAALFHASSLLTTNARISLRSNLGAMLEIGAKQKMVLNNEPLYHDILQAAGLGQDRPTDKSDETVDWVLVEQVIKVFPQHVVPRQDPNLPRRGKSDIFGLVMARITSDTCFSHSIERQQEDSPADQMTYDSVRSRLLPLLMNSCKAARAYTEFLGTWHERLLELYNKQGSLQDQSHYQLHLFQDPELTTSVTQNLISTMPAIQKKDAIKSLAMDEPSGPALTVLLPLLLDLSIRQKTDEDCEALYRIICRTSSLLARDANAHEKSIYWRVLETSTRQWLSDANAKSLNNAMVVSSPPSPFVEILKQMINLWKAVQKRASHTKYNGADVYLFLAVESLAWFGTWTAACEQRHFSLDSNEDLRNRCQFVLQLVNETRASKLEEPALSTIQTVISSHSQLSARLGSSLQLGDQSHEPARPLSAAINSRNVEKREIARQRQIMTDPGRPQVDDQKAGSKQEVHSRFLATSLALEQLSPEIRLSALYNALPSGTESLHDSSLRRLNFMILARNDWPGHVDISPVISILIQKMSLSSSFASFDISTSSLLHVLRLKKIHPSQHALESIVVALIRMLGTGPSSLRPRYCRKIYARLCQVLQVLLARNTLRKRLRSRMHLLLQPLQGLMRCLFIATSRSPSLQIKQPQWLRFEQRYLDVPTNETAGTEQHKTLDNSSASNYVRVLTLLADPPLSAVSSVSASRNKPSKDGDRQQSGGPLTDAVAQARINVAHFAPLLLGEYANCLLRGRFCADGVREALQPGIWALLDVLHRHGIGIDALGSITGGAEGAREVLRGVISDWRRATGGLSSR